VTIEGSTYSGPAVVDSADDRVRLWRSEPHTLDVTLAGGNGSTRVEGCVGVASTENDTVRTLDCQVTTVDNETGGTLSFGVDEWPENETLGDRTVVVTVKDNPSKFKESSLLDRETVAVQVVEKSGNLDSDRLTNGREALLGTNMTRSDTDGDGLRDGEEIHEYGTNPTEPDSDVDGVRDADEIRRGTDPVDADTDGDGLTDGEEVNEHDTNPRVADTDGDGLTDGEEVDEYDTDPSDADTDGDGLADGEEVDEYDTNPSVADTDGDGLADGTEITLRSDPTSVATPLAYVLVLLASFVGAGLVLVRRTGVSDLAFALTERPSTDAAGDAAAGGEAAPGETTRGPDSTPETEDAPPSPRLISDEDRVLRLLDDHAGRLPQSEIVERTDWSKSKVSRLLSKMEENEQVKKITIGRENLITRRSDDPLGSDQRGPSGR